MNDEVDEKLRELLDSQSAAFRLQFLAFFETLQEQMGAAKAVPEPAAATGLCPVAEQVADLTERLDAALLRLAEMEAVANANQSAIYLLTHVAENHTNALDNMHSAVEKMLGLRRPTA